MLDPGLVQSFWRSVRRGRGCWPWTRGVNSAGYGKLKFRCRWHYAHRVSYAIHHGPIPSGLCVMHKCDNPICVNPKHLKAGTIADNNRDMYAKGRGRKAVAA